MKTFYKYFCTIFASTYIGVFFLRIYHYGFIYENPGKIIKGCLPTVLITLALILICSLFQWPLLNNFDEIIEKGKKTRDSITKKDIARLNKIYRNYDIIIIVAHIIGFLIGAGSTALLEAKKSGQPLNPITFTLIEMQSLATGFMCYTINYVLVKRIHMAGLMREVGMKMSENLFRVQNVAMWASVDASIINMMTVPYGIIVNSKLPGSHFDHFVTYSLIGWFTSLVEFFIVFKVITKRIQKTQKTVSDNLITESTNLAEATRVSAANSQNQSAAVKEIVSTMHDSTELANNIG